MKLYEFVHVFAALLLLGLASMSCSETPPRKVLIVGIDGANWKVIEPLMKEGELPAFQMLIDKGAYTSEFEVASTVSPIAWNNVATGRRARVHGILGFTTELPGGELIPVSSNQRKARALWEVASSNGLKVGVAGWWASWPAETVNGWVITDHANPANTEFLTKEQKYWTADEELLRKMEKDFFPAEIGSILEKYWIDSDEFPYEEVHERSGISAEQLELLKKAPWNKRTYYSFFKTFYRVDYPLAAAARDLMEQQSVDLALVYLRGPDPIQHYAWDFVEPERFPQYPPTYDRDRGLVEGVYRYTDSLLMSLLEQVDPNTWVFVLSDHGAEPNPGFESRPKHGRAGEHTSAAKGVFFMKGPNVVPGPILSEATPYDIFPTVCWLLNLPISEELRGRVLEEAFQPEFVEAVSETAKYIDTYGVRETKPLETSPADEELLKQLRSLGYIK